MLNENDKAQYVWDQGMHLLNAKTNQDSFSLYQVSDFYVEFILSKSEIKEIRAFKKGVHLDKYIDRIKLIKLYG